MEQGLSLGEVERRVRAWIARLTIEFQTKIVENDGLSGLLSASETEAMGAEQATEIDRLLNLTILRKMLKNSGMYIGIFLKTIIITKPGSGSTKLAGQKLLRSWRIGVKSF